MNPSDHDARCASRKPRGTALLRWARWMLMAAGLTTLVAACGGGVGSETEKLSLPSRA